MKESWKNTMRSLKLEYIKSISPGFFELSGGYKMKTKAYTDKSANGLTKCIVDFINYSGGSATRINTTGQRRKINGTYHWTFGTTRKGTADIHAIYQGRHISIEVKIDKDRLSKYQLSEAERIRRAGGYYVVATDMQTFLEWFYDTFNTQC
jgi:hypothetical protein